MSTSEGFTAKELSGSTWNDFEQLFAKHNGVWGGCWCMYYHDQGSFRTGPHNKARKRTMVRQGQSHGIIVYSGGNPVGWCQYGTQQELPRLGKSRTYQKLGLESDGKEKLWRITCFFVDRDFRGRGVAGFALKTALSSIRQKGGGVVEAYPLEDLKEIKRKTAKGKASFMWSGTVPMFQKEGFEIVASLGKSRRLVRTTVR